MTRTYRTVTRTQVAAVLAAAGRPDIAEGIYARRLDDGSTALAIDFDDAADMTLLAVALTNITTPAGALHLASSTRTGLPGHPTARAATAAWWPGWVLDEPTWEQWTDMVNGCGPCYTVDDEPCPIHRHAPWDVPFPAVVA